MLPRHLAALLVPLALLTTPARADWPEEEREAPTELPGLSGEYEVDVYGALALRGRRPARANAVWVRGEFFNDLNLTSRLRIHTFVKLESLGSTSYGETERDAFFRDQVAFLQNFNIGYDILPGMEVFGGKFTPPLGVGFDMLPGIRLDIRAEAAYELVGPVGFGTNWRLPVPEALGTQRLHASIFYQDTSFLTEDAITRVRFGTREVERYRSTRRFQGGPGNDGTLDNAAIALDGFNIPALPGLAYHLGYVTRGAGDDGTRREHAFAVAFRQRFDLGDERWVAAYGEAVLFRNADGRPVENLPDGTRGPVSERRLYTSLAVSAGQGPWRVAAGWQRDARRRSANGVPDENYIEATVGRELGAGFSADIGVSRTRFALADGRSVIRPAALAKLSWSFRF